MGILAHISEFGFVLASKGVSWGLLSRHAYLLLVGANAISLCFAPWLFQAWELLQLSPTSPPSSPPHAPARKMKLERQSGTPEAMRLRVHGHGDNVTGVRDAI